MNYQLENRTIQDPDSRNIKYLDPNLSITKVHDNFNKHSDTKVSYGIFAKVLATFSLGIQEKIYAIPVPNS